MKLGRNSNELCNPQMIVPFFQFKEFLCMYCFPPPLLFCCIHFIKAIFEIITWNIDQWNMPHSYTCCDIDTFYISDTPSEYAY